MSLQAADQAMIYCLQHGLEVYLQDAAQLYAAQHSLPSSSSGSSNDPAVFMAHYLTAAVCGQHLPWRHYALVSGARINPTQRPFIGRMSVAASAPVCTLMLLHGLQHHRLLLYCCRHPPQQKVLLGGSAAQPETLQHSRPADFCGLPFTAAAVVPRLPCISGQECLVICSSCAGL